jgi:hypothetical protein
MVTVTLITKIQHWLAQFCHYGDMRKTFQKASTLQFFNIHPVDGENSSAAITMHVVNITAGP